MIDEKKYLYCKQCKWFYQDSLTYTFDSTGKSHAVRYSKCMKCGTDLKRMKCPCSKEEGRSVDCPVHCP